MTRSCSSGAAACSRDARLYFVCEARPRRARPRRRCSRRRCRGGVGHDPAARQGRRRARRWSRPRAPSARSPTATGRSFIVNDEPDLVARCCEPTASTSARTTLPVAEARAIAGPAALVGLSTHSPEQIDAAVAATGASRPDHISVGPGLGDPDQARAPGRGAGADPSRRADGRRPALVRDRRDRHRATSPRSSPPGRARVVVVRAIRDAADPGAAAAARCATRRCGV